MMSVDVPMDVSSTAVLENRISHLNLNGEHVLQASPVSSDIGLQR